MVHWFTSMHAQITLGHGLVTRDPNEVPYMYSYNMGQTNCGLLQLE